MMQIPVFNLWKLPEVRCSNWLGCWDGGVSAPKFLKGGSLSHQISPLMHASAAPPLTGYVGFQPAELSLKSGCPWKESFSRKQVLLTLVEVRENTERTETLINFPSRWYRPWTPRYSRCQTRRSNSRICSSDTQSYSKNALLSSRLHSLLPWPY